MPATSTPACTPALRRSPWASATPMCAPTSVPARPPSVVGLAGTATCTRPSVPMNPLGRSLPSCSACVVPACTPSVTVRTRSATSPPLGAGAAARPCPSATPTSASAADAPTRALRELGTAIPDAACSIEGTSGNTALIRAPTATALLRLAGTASFCDRSAWTPGGEALVAAAVWLSTADSARALTVAAKASWLVGCSYLSTSTLRSSSLASSDDSACDTGW